MLIVFLYVDDLIFIGNFGIEEFKLVMTDGFEMTDLRFMSDADPYLSRVH